MGKDSGSIIQVREEARKSAGDSITFGLRLQLTGNGVIGDGTLEGQEESLTTYSQAVIINQLRHAVRTQGRMSQQRVAFDIREEALSGLRDWWADRIDYAFFNQVCGNTVQTNTAWTGNQATIAPDQVATTGHYINTFSSTSVIDTDITAAGTFSFGLIDRAIERAKTLVPAIRPVRINGGQFYVMVLHPYVVTDMRQSTATGQWLDLQKVAMTGGVTKDNPIFTGALGIYNGCILHADFRIPLGCVTTTATANTRRNIFLGAQACMCAYGKDGGDQRYTWVEELFDYENQLGVSAGQIFGMQKTVFNSKDYATIVASSYAAAH